MRRNNQPFLPAVDVFARIHRSRSALLVGIEKEHGLLTRTNAYLSSLSIFYVVHASRPDCAYMVSLVSLLLFNVRLVVGTVECCQLCSVLDVVSVRDYITCQTKLNKT